MNSRFLNLLQITLAGLDIVAINLAFFVTKAYLVNQAYNVNGEEYIYLSFFLNIAWLFIAWFCNVYEEKKIVSFELFSGNTARAFIYYIGLVVLFAFFNRMVVVSPAVLFVFIVFGALAIFLCRIIYIVIYQHYKDKEYLRKRVIVVGYNSLSKKLVTYLEENGINTEIIGFCEDFDNVEELSNYPILTNISGALDACKEYGVTEIYSTIAPEHDSNIYKLIQNADQNCIRFRIIPDLGFFIKRQIHIDYLKDIPIISLRSEPLEDLGNRIKKRLFDIVVSFLVIVLILSWLLPIISLLIWLESKGSPFFIQDRTGKDNKNFRCIKFRSMHVNDTANSLQATKDDARITKIGKFLRRTSLDEFPQFLNVFRGDMSVIGPRPHMLKHTDDYSKLISQYMVRQFVKPGISGWAQVNGFRGETQTLIQMQQRVKYDLWYMANWSFWLDIKIMFLTVLNALKGESNAF